MADLAIKITASDQASGVLGKLGGALGGLAGAVTAPLKGMLSLGQGIGMLGVAVGGLSSLAGAIGSVATGMVSGNAEFERYETQFGVLLKSSDAAKQRLAELADFGAKTPFELPEVVRADKVLTAFGLDSETTARRFGVSGAQIRTTIGDVASGTGASFEELSVTFGKFASGATGEAIARFQELGIATREEMASWGLEFSKTGQLLTPADEAFTILEKNVRAKFGGMMDAQSNTFEGMVSNLQDWLTQTKIALMAPVFKVLEDQLKGFLEMLNGPAAKAALDSIGKTLANGVGIAIGAVKNLISGVQAVMGYLDPGNKRDLMREWFGDFGPTIDGVVRGVKDIAATVAGFASDLASGDWGVFLDDIGEVFGGNVKTTIMSFTSFIGTAIPAALKLAGDAWTNILLPAIQAFLSFEQNVVAPALSTLFDWLSTNIPAAISTVSGFWTGTLKPAIQTVSDFITGTVIPALGKVYDWLQTSIPAAINTVSGFWTGTLQPAIQKVSDFITGTVVPALTDAYNWLATKIPEAVTTVTGVFDNTLIPGFQKVSDWLSTNMPKAAQTTTDIFANTLKPALNDVAKVFNDYLKPFGDAVIGVFGAMGNILIDKLTPAAKDIWSKLTDLAKVISDALTPALNAASAKGGPLDALAGAFQWVLDRVREATGFLRTFEDTLNRLSGKSVPGVGTVPGGIGNNAAGTDFWRGGTTWVGERGPELVNLPRGSSVTPASQVKGGVSIGAINIYGNATQQDVTNGVLAAARSMGAA